MYVPLSVLQFQTEAAKFAALKMTAQCSSETTLTYEKHTSTFCDLFNNPVNGSEEYLKAGATD